MATATAAPPAEIWKEALKCRRNLEKKAEQLQRSVGNGSENALLEALDEGLSAFRLGSVATVFTDFEFATDQKVDKLLWQAHALINNKYRSMLSILSSREDPKLVLHRQVERKYGKFLRTSQYFYKGYLQRLSQRYPIPVLERVARSVKADDVPLGEIPRERDSGLDVKVLVSCHSTLLHLGDLARYRRQVDRKPHGFDKPLVYYRLANELVPTSGYGHHQMAVVFIAEKERDLAVVYHLYRALAAEEPHPNALQNLEVEFKKLRPSSPPRGRNASLDPKITLASWFVKLQAIFYTGESVPQQTELEREVVHRMQMLLVTRDSIDMLLMMALTNMTAYHIARQRTEKKWSAELSRSCQFILGFNVRMVLAVCRVLTREIRDALNAIPGDCTASDAETKESDRFLAAMAAAVPVLRVYMIWLCLHRTEIVKYAAHLPQVAETHSCLAETLSLLIEVFRREDHDVSAIKYMLREDIETMGFRPLTSNEAPFVCRTLHFTLEGEQKLRLEDGASERLSDNLETLSRIHDIINCGYFLATDPNYPLEVTQTRIGSLVLATIAATALGSRPTPVTGTVLQPVTPQKAMPSHPTELSNANETRPGTARTGTSAPKPPSNLGRDESVDADFGVDGETLDRVNEFLIPPEVNSPKSPAVMDESSYGMHSSTANEIFGALDPVATTPTSASKKAFPGLPWDLVYMPTPYRSTGVGGDSPAMPPFAEIGMDSSNMGAPSHPVWLHQASPSAAQTHRASHPRGPVSEQPITGLKKGEIYDRERMEEVAKAASWNVQQRHRPVLVPASSMPPSQLPGSSSMPSLSSPSSRSPGRAQQQQQSPSYTATPFFQSSNFSPNESGLPPVNSPWGLPPMTRSLVVEDSGIPTAAPKWPSTTGPWEPGTTASKNETYSMGTYGSMSPAAAESSSSTYEHGLLLQHMAEQAKTQAAGRL